MSWTMSPGLVGASHWTFVAAAMADALRRMLAGMDDPALMPAGVHRAARGFFRTAVAALDGRCPPDPPATAANYHVATRALRFVVVGEEYDRILADHAEVVESLDPDGGRPRPGDEDLLQLASFFEQLARDGEAEAYEGWSRIDDLDC